MALEVLGEDLGGVPEEMALDGEGEGLEDWECEWSGKVLYPQGIEADEAEAEDLAGEEGIFGEGRGFFGLEVAFGLLEDGSGKESVRGVVFGGHGGESGIL